MIFWVHKKLLYKKLIKASDERDVRVRRNIDNWVWPEKAQLVSNHKFPPLVEC